MATSISEVKIGNMALSNIGTRSTIESFTESTPEAQQIDLHYNFARSVALSSFPWSFATKRIALAEHSDDPPDEWAFRYQYPSDCLVARRIVNPAGTDNDPVPFTVEGNDDGTQKTILTDQDEACLVYTFDQETTALFTVYFVRTLSFMLAHLISPTLTGKDSITVNMWNQFRFLIGQASASDANEGQAPPKREAPWIESRGFGTGSEAVGAVLVTTLPDANN